MTDQVRAALTAGHSKASPGAVAGGFTEQALCRSVVDETTAILRGRGVEVYDPMTDLTELPYPAYLLQRIEDINGHGATCAVEMHLNAASDPRTDYALCLHAPGSAEGERLATHLAKALAEATPERESMARPDTWLGPGRSKAFLRRTAMPAVIVEPSFLTSPDVQAEIRRDTAAWRERIARACAKGIVDWVDGSTDSR